MNINHYDINTDLRAHPDVFNPRDDIYEDNKESNHIYDNKTRTRSNSGSTFERTNRIMGEQQPTLSQSYGGDRFSAFLFRQGDLSPTSRLYR